jgi:class 3 adenylate cyclase
MEAPPLERRLAAILAADVEGYSRLMNLDEEATMATLSNHRRVADELIGRHGGRITNTAGDSVLAEFGSVLDAVECAIAVQQAIETENQPLPDERRMRFRIGINVGDVMVKDGDIFGDGVNIAARLQGIAGVGCICVSRGVHDHLRHRGRYAFDDLGEQQVKNIPHPVRAFHVRLADGDAPAASRDGDGQPMAPDGADEAKLAAAAEAVPEPVPEPMPEALDLAFWESVRDSERAEDFQAYLDRHPDGHFATLARHRLDDLTSAPAPPAGEGRGGAGAEKIELAFWESVSDADDPALFQAYLDKYPEGNFAAIATTRLARLQAVERAPA